MTPTDLAPPRAQAQALSATMIEGMFWFWLGLGAAFLGLDVWVQRRGLVWPAAAAGLTGTADAINLLPALWEQGALFGLLCLGLMVGARRLTAAGQAGDLRAADIRSRLIGQAGQAATAFVEGSGRVFVEGAEWAASGEPDVDIREGDRVVVSAVDAERLIVRRVSSRLTFSR